MQVRVPAFVFLEDCEEFEVFEPRVPFEPQPQISQAALQCVGCVLRVWIDLAGDCQREKGIWLGFSGYSNDASAV